MPNLYCISLRGKSLTDEMRCALFDTAQEMIQNNTQELDMPENGMSGRITTQFKRAHINGENGIIFQEEVKTAGGKSKV